MYIYIIYIYIYIHVKLIIYVHILKSHYKEIEKSISLKKRMMVKDV